MFGFPSKTKTKTKPSKSSAFKPSYNPIRSRKDMTYLVAHEQPLFRLSKKDNFCLGTAYEGIQIFGGTGSGKTSGSGRTLAYSFLRSGFGGLVLCAKPSEREDWERYARACNRSDSVIVIDGTNGNSFNFLDYELARIDAGASIDNVVSVFMNIMDASDREQKSSSSENSFWKKASREYLSNAIELLYIAYGKVKLIQLFELSQSLPSSAEDMQNPAFQEKSFFFQTIAQLQSDPANPVDVQDLRVISNYFAHTFTSLDKKTKSNLIVTLSSMVSPFMKGRMRELFASETTVIPEMSHEGAIIIVDLPLKIWEQAGIVGQHIFKYAWQRSTERRDIDGATRPVFLWADESQFFVSQYDKEFQSTARSSKACTVYLTQSINGYFTALGDEHAAYEFLTNFQTKIFHANSDPKTNEYASEIVGKHSQYRKNHSESRNDTYSSGSSISKSKSESWNSSYSPPATIGGSGSNSASFGESVSKSFTRTEGRSYGSGNSSGVNEVMDYLLQPSFFGSRLRKGGKSNDFRVDGVIMTGGQNYSNSLPFMVVGFSQQ